MLDLEGKIAKYLQECRALDGIVQDNNAWQADSMVFDIQDVRGREVIVSLRFIEILQGSEEGALERVDRYCQLRLELDEFGEILSAGIY